MRNAKRNTLIITALMVAFSILAVTSLSKLILTSPKHELTGLEYILGDMEYAVGNDYGLIYSIDGTQIAEENDGHYSAINGYSEIIGDESGGMIYELKSILLANSCDANKLVTALLQLYIQPDKRQHIPFCQIMVKMWRQAFVLF